MKNSLGRKSRRKVLEEGLGGELLAMLGSRRKYYYALLSKPFLYLLSPGGESGTSWTLRDVSYGGIIGSGSALTSAKSFLGGSDLYLLNHIPPPYTEPYSKLIEFGFKVNDESKDFTYMGEGCVFNVMAINSVAMKIILEIISGSV